MIAKIAQLLREKIKPQSPEHETEFLPAALEVLETPPSPVGQIMLWTFFILITGILLWTLIGKVDEVAVAPGKLLPVGHVKVVQAEDKGVVKSIYVKDGQKVVQGEVLLEFDTILTAADVARIRKTVAYYSLESDRLTAEKEERLFVPQKYPDLEEKDIDFQVKLYQSRLIEYNSKLSTAEFNIKQNEANLSSNQATYAKYVSLYEIASKKEKRIEQLVNENAIAMFTLFDHQEKRLELEHNIMTQTSEIARLEWALLQSREAVRAVIAERNRDISTQLVDDRKQLQANMEELKKVEEKNRLSRIVAPIDGRISQLAIHTLGGIVTPAQELLQVVPEDAELQVEAWVANKDIGFIKPDQAAEVKIETFSFQKYGTIDATVVDISPDAVEDKEKGRVYRVLLRLDKNSFIVNDHYAALSPGMTATGEIKIRRKRIIEFFLDPFRQYQSEALRER